MSNNLKDKILSRIEQIKSDLMDLKNEKHSFGEWVDVASNNDIEQTALLLEYEMKVLFELIEGE